MEFKKEKIGEGICKYCDIPFTRYKITIVGSEYFVCIVTRKDGKEGQHMYSPFFRKCVTVFDEEE